MGRRRRRKSKRAASSPTPSGTVSPTALPESSAGVSPVAAEPLVQRMAALPVSGIQKAALVGASLLLAVWLILLVVMAALT